MQDTTQELVDRARRGEGPAFIECMTYRYYGHHVGDINRAYYRPKAEEQDWRDNRDPLTLLEKKLLETKLVEKSTIDQINASVQKEIEEGMQFAINAPYPNISEVSENVYA